MKIEIATLFPEMCESVLAESIIGRARKKGAVEISCRNIRDYTLDRHRRVDDTPYGGGMGMVMQADPIFNCYSAVCDEWDEGCTDKSYTAAGHELLHSLRLSTRVVVSVTFEEVDYTPDTETGTKSNYECLKYAYC